MSGWRDGTLFPDLDGYPSAGGFAMRPQREQQEDEAAARKWWAAWERSHLPGRTCPGCGRPGGKVWLTLLEGPRPWHEECANA